MCGSSASRRGHLTICIRSSCRKTARQPHQDELGNDIYGNPAVTPYVADSIRNEAAALQFLSEHTTRLKTTASRISNAMEHRGVDVRDLDPSALPSAVDKLTVQLEEKIFS
ncbi:Protein kinase-like domain protein [Niveomyces insectorum RCEF 264]|uniref:Protein kinase-like domain protein n=1 Tax=Niveomyces insectorum RCEF 264 TaxID=1081102 RepID=A0A167P4T3_9HYPO|nr:Protein kinase-like domain protein [Niveomyces insectorum RCEF 264]